MRRLGQFYVYVLFRPDTGQSCYVGKGQGRRWLAQIEKTPTNLILKRIVAKLGCKLIPVKIRTHRTDLNVRLERQRKITERKGGQL